MYYKYMTVLFLGLCSSRALNSVLPMDTEHLQASVGGFAVFNCHLDFPFGHEMPYYLQWEKDGETILSWYSEDESSKMADKYGGRVSRLADGKLGLGRGSINVSAIREADAGLYRCLVIFPNRTPRTRNNGTFYYLDVEGGNLLVTPPMNATVLEGERVELECYPKMPDSVVIWYKDRTLVKEQPELVARLIFAENGSLVIPNATITDPGEYECRVEAADGQSQAAAAFLDVQYKAKVLYAPPERYLPFGKPASLDCHFSANPPLTNLRWEKDGFLFDPYNVPGVFYSRNGSLLFNQVDESHEGSYSCTPYNILGTEGPSPSMKVLVQKPPIFEIRPLSLYMTRLGSSITMPCSTRVFDSYAVPVIAWIRKDNVPLPEDRYTINNGNITITNVQESDRGVYTCMATNEASVVTAETELLIENVPPKAPHNLTALPSADSVHLTWTPGHSDMETDYTVWYRKQSSHIWHTLKILSMGVTQATLLGLAPGETYEMRVLCDYHGGDGLFSKPIFVRTLDENIQNAETYIVPVTQSSVLTSPLHVSVRLIDEGALVVWDRDPLDESRCTLFSYSGTDKRNMGVKYSTENYVLVPEVINGEHYWFRVECLSGSTGTSTFTVPDYNRLRTVAVGCTVAIILAILAVALYFGRETICANMR